MSTIESYFKKLHGGSRDSFLNKVAKDKPLCLILACLSATRHKKSKDDKDITQIHPLLVALRNHGWKESYFKLLIKEIYINCWETAYASTTLYAVLRYNGGKWFAEASEKADCLIDAESKKVTESQPLPNPYDAIDKQPDYILKILDRSKVSGTARLIADQRKIEGFGGDCSAAVSVHADTAVRPKSAL